MKKWQVSAAMVSSLSALPTLAATTDVTTYIVNGTTTSISTYKSFVSLFYDRIEYDGVYGVGSYCGGTMLDATHVLTAAHCIFDGSGNLDEDYMLFTVVGQTDDESAFPLGNIETVRASEFYYHPDYEDSSTNLWPNDIAIIKLASSLNVAGYETVTSSQAYRLGSDGSDDDDNDYLFQAVGHGNTSTGEDSTDDLLYTNMTYVSNATCQSDLPSLTSKQVCFKGSATNSSTGLDNGTCQGDSGGPIYWNYGGSLTQIGLVSFGPTTCGVGTSAADVDAVFTNISSYSSWINSVIAGSVTPDYTATDAKRTAYLNGESTVTTTSSSSSSSGGSPSPWGLIVLVLLAAIRWAKFA